jgi:putative transposase
VSAQWKGPTKADCSAFFRAVCFADGSAVQHGGRAYHSLSLTATLQLFGNPWLSNAVRWIDIGMWELFFEHQITIKVGQCPGRNEPRANKRRPKILQLLTKPRHEAKAELEFAA